MNTWKALWNGLRKTIPPVPSWYKPINLVNDKRLKYILLVEDSDLLQRMLKKLLEDRQFMVHAVSTGNEAINCIVSNVYDLAIVDLRLPDETDGLKVIEQIKIIQPETIVIGMTGFPTAESITKMNALGCQSVLIKPFQPQEMINQVLNFMSS